ncbi:MAG: hypothetical protein AB1457_18430, partial [Chloroflexota bacterium]
LMINNDTQEISHTLSSVTKMVVLRGIGISLAALLVLDVAGHPALALGSLIGIGTALTTIPIIYARCRGSLTGFGFSMFLKALFTLITGCVGGWLYGSAGALVGECLGTMAALLHTWPKGLVASTQSFSEVRVTDRMARSAGKPITVQSVNNVVQQNVERWIVAATLGLEGAGKFGLAQLFVTGVNLVHATFFQQAGAKVLPDLASGQSKQQVMLQLLRFSGLIGAVSFSVVVIAAIGASQFLPPLITHIDRDEFKWCLVWLTVGATIQMLHYSDWLMIGCHKQRSLEHISWMLTMASCLLHGFGWLTSQAFEYFLFCYALTRLFLLTASWYSAWKAEYQNQDMASA